MVYKSCSETGYVIISFLSLFFLFSSFCLSSRDVLESHSNEENKGVKQRDVPYFAYAVSLPQWLQDLLQDLDRTQVEPEAPSRSPTGAAGTQTLRSLPSGSCCVSKSVLWRSVTLVGETGLSC